MGAYKLNISKNLVHCCGCGECQSICRFNAIKMEYNQEGFLYPDVDKSLCKNCGQCVKHCSFNSGKYLNDFDTPLAYAVKHSNELVRLNSQSGGMFTLLSDVILDRGGIVYGCQLVDNRIARHVRVDSREKRDLLRGSKYIQSETYTVFGSIEQDLKQGYEVLFTGTSCQVNAVKDYITSKKLEEKLYTADIVCHGVPSPKVWKDYVDYVEKKEQEKSSDANFRNKKYGWNSHVETITFKNKEYSSGLFANLFYKHNILRNDCFECPYRNTVHPGDITLADCWGVKESYPDFYDDKGVSLALVNNQKGKLLFEQASNNAVVISVELKRVMQPPLKENWGRPAERKYFWKYYNKYGFDEMLNVFVYHKARKTTIFERLKIKCNNLIKKLKRK